MLRVFQAKPLVWNSYTEEAPTAEFQGALYRQSNSLRSIRGNGLFLYNQICANNIKKEKAK